MVIQDILGKLNWKLSPLLRYVKIFVELSMVIEKKMFVWTMLEPPS